MHLTLDLPVAAPYAADELLGFLAHRVITGVEQAITSDQRPGYARSLQLAHGDAIMVLSSTAGAVHLDAVLADARDHARLIIDVTHLLDLDTDATAVDAHLGADPLLARFVASRPGLRVPGTVDGAELAVRTLIGQQVSLAGAAAAAAKITTTYGSTVSVRHPRAPTITHLFPSMPQLAAAEAATLPMPRARGRALVGLAAAFASGSVSLSADTDPGDARDQLLGLPGIGPWTADYVIMRALHAPDVLLTTDLAIKRELARLGEPDTARWAPWRSYATMHLWHAYLAR